jgi:short-subunit dehydrogenase
MKIQNRTFIVTGAGGGIGSALVLGILERGGKVAAIDIKQEALDTTKAKAGEAFANNISLHALNITDRSAVEALPAAVLEEHGSVEGLINCAGIIQPFVKINDLEYDAIDRVMNVNFNGTLFMTKAFLPYLLQCPEAHIVNVSSMGGFLPVPGQSIYGASKAAVKLMTEGLYAELIDTSVHVSVVFPGATATDITKNSNVTTPNNDDSSSAKKMSIKMLQPSQAAQIILNGVEKNKVQIFTGNDSRMMNRLYRINPVSATKLIAKQMRSLLK